MNTRSGNLHVRRYGGQGRPIVLIHGLGGSVANWDAIGPGLSELGEVVALDLPGFGLSPPGNDWTLDTHAEAATAFLEHCGSPVTLVGNSMGGLVSEMVAGRHADLVDRLVLIAPATPPRLPDPRIHWPTARRLAVQATPGLGPAITRSYFRRYTPAELVRRSLEAITRRPENVPIPMVEEFTRLARIRAALPWTTRAVPHTGRSIARTFRRPSGFVAMIRDIKAPTLVIHGIEDHIVSPTSVEWLCSLRPDWKFVQMERTGHTPQIDAPVRTLDVLVHWLEQTYEREIGA